jgi:hypothetical protein
MRRAALIALAALSLLPAAASADGDPASDVLLAQDVYYPYAPKASPQMSKALNGLLARVRKAGYPMKVALIQTPADLGAYPNLFGDTQSYANLLAKEIAFNSRPHLLTVMPTGFGGDNLGAQGHQDRRGREVRRPDPGGARRGRANRHRQRASDAGPAGGHCGTFRLEILLRALHSVSPRVRRAGTAGADRGGRPDLGRPPTRARGATGRA